MPEEIYLGKLSKYFRDTHRQNKMDLSTKTDEMRNKNNWQDNNRKRKNTKAAATKT